MQNGNFFVHPSSVIEEGATVGEGTQIWFFCHVMPKAIIGKDCTVDQNCFIDNNAVVGNNVKNSNNRSVHDGVVIEDDVFIGPSVAFTNVINPRSFIDRKNEFKKTIVRKGSSIGANATIMAGVTVGQYAMIGAGAIVTKDVLKYSIVSGNPAELAGWISEAGHKLNFDLEGKAICKENASYIKLKTT